MLRSKSDGRWQENAELKVGSGLGGLLLFGLLQAGIAAGLELALKFLNSARCVNILELAREEGMAHVTDIYLELLARTPGRKPIPAAALDRRLKVFRMDSVLHRRDS